MKSTAGTGMMKGESNDVTRRRLFLVIVSTVVITLSNTQFVNGQAELCQSTAPRKTTTS